MMSNGLKRNASADFLLIGGGFFGYAREISIELERRGRRVAWFEDRPALDTFTKSAIRLAPSLIAAKCEAYFDGVIASVHGPSVKDVLVIKGEALSCRAIRKLRCAMPHARFTLYFWDSYGNMPRDSVMKVGEFDKAFTFDPVDARVDDRLIYRPLFFLPEYAALPAQDSDIDLLFIGTAHSDRYSVLKRLEQNLPTSVRFEKILYFPSRAVYAVRRFFDPRLWRASRKEFIFQPLSKMEIQSHIARARAIVDIERKAQQGLTMRTVEVFGAAKKLITTNPRIMEADIFDSNNMAVIDRSNPRLIQDFLRIPYVPPDPFLLARYSLSGWLNEVLHRD